MATFPRVVAMIARPSQIWSLGKAVTANVPVTSTLYGLGKLTDGSMGLPTRLAFGTAQVTVDLGTSRTPNFAGILNHNIDAGRVIGITNDGGLGRGFGARDPNCWIDLRGFPTTARHWTFAVNGNSVPLSLSEIVIGTADVFADGLFEDGFTEQLDYPGYTELTEYNREYRSMSGALTRSSSPRLEVSATDQVKLDAVFDEVGISGGRVVVIPSSRINDIWYIEWPDTSEYTYPNQTLRSIGIALREQVGAVLNGR